MGSGNEPAGQQAMTSERLAWVLEHIATIPAGREHTFVPVADLQMLRAEVERLLAREATLVAYVAGMATFSPAARIEDIQRQIIAARALLAAQADDAARGEQKGQ